MPYDQLSDNLPRDAGSKAFVGPAGRIPKGFPDPDNENEATPYVILVGADGETPLFSSNGVYIQGKAAHGNTVEGNPIILGGRGTSGIPSPVTDGQVVRALFDLLGQLAVVPKETNGNAVFPPLAAMADDTTNPTLTKIATYLMAFDGSTWDRVRGTSANGILTNKSKVALTGSTPATVTIGTTSATLINANGGRKGLIVGNCSATAVLFLSLSGAAVLNSGLMIPPYGVWTMGDYDYVTTGMNAISTEANTPVALQEFT